MRSWWKCCLWVPLALLWGSCSSSSTHSAPTCESNDISNCEGDDGCQGTRSCVEGTWSACQCGPTTTANSSSTNSSTSSGGSTNSSTGTGGTQHNASSSGGTSVSSGSDAGGTGGSTGSTGGSDAGGAGGSSNGGSSSGGGTSGNTGGSAGSGGDAGTGGSGGAGTGPVQGRVVNHFRQPVDGAKVMIGSDSTTTDDDGEFEFSAVPPEYDLYVTFVNDDVDRVQDEDPQGWVYQGLSRRDPTIQVYGGLPGRSSQFDVYPTVSDTSFRIGVTLGGEYTTWSRVNIAANGAQLIGLGWYGPVTVTATGHALAWAETDGLPTSYHGFDKTALLLFDSTASSSERNVLQPDLTDANIASGTISGTANAAMVGDRSNLVYVRFTTNGVIPIIDHDISGAETNFSYLVPTLPDATITVAAQEEGEDAIAVAFQSGVSAGTTNIQLEIPEYSSLDAPGVAAFLTEDTVFQWSNDATVSVWMMRNSYYNRDYVYVVTTKKELTVPTFPDGYTNLHPETLYAWQVETHGDFDSVDDAAGPNGMMSEFNYSRTYPSWPSGPSVSSGTYTLSEWGYVNTVTQ